MKLRIGVLLPRKFYNLSTENIVLDVDMKAKYGRSQFLYTILLHMADLYNFTIEIVEVDPRKRQDNSAPMFVAFQKKTVDISASPIVMKAERLRSGDIIGPIWPMRSCFLFRTISSLDMKPKQFLRPLNIKVWYVALGTMVIAAVILIILIRQQEGIHSLSEACSISILFTIGAVSQQGSVFVPVHYASRIAFIHIMLFSVLMLNYYSASIVSDRLKNKGVKMNDSLISLADSYLKVAAEPTPYVRSFLQTPEKEIRYFNAKRWDKLPESKRYLPLAEGLDRVAKGGLAYHTSTEAAYPYIERHFHPRMICELTEVHLFQAILALWGRYRSPFTPLLRIGLIKMYDVGIRKRQLKFWSARKPFCPRNLLVAEPLSITEATPVFAFVGVTATLSLVICIIENLVCWLRPRLSISTFYGGKLYCPTFKRDIPVSPGEIFSREGVFIFFYRNMCKLKLQHGAAYLALFLVFSRFTCNADPGDSEFIRDYFVKKAVRNVVGFSCGDFTSDFYFVRSLSRAGIFTIIRKHDTNINLRRFLSTHAWSLGVFVDLRCRNESAVAIFAETSKYRMYDYSYHWLVLGSKLNKSTPLLNDSAYGITTDVALAIINGTGYDLYDVFNHCKYRGGMLNVTKLGTWRRREGLIITLTQPLIERRADMHGMTLKMSGVIQYRPKNMRLEDYMHDINTRSLDSMHKFLYAMISHTADLFNFSVHASEIIYWDRHSVHGLIFEILQTNYIDFGSNPRIMVSERLDYATLIGAAWPIRPCFLLLSSPSNNIKLEIFFKPFSVYTWYLSGVFIVFFMFVMRIIMNHEETSTEDTRVEKYSNAVVVTVSITAQQGANFFPERIPGRIAFLQILVFNWIMYNYYSGSIVSARLSEPLDMMEDDVTVLADSDLRIAAEAVPYLNYFLYKLSSESSYFRKKRWDPLPESKRYLPLDEGMKQVSEGTLAYHTDPNTAYPYVEKTFEPHKICALTEIHLFKQSVMGMYASRNGQFTEMAKIGLSKMFNTGLRDRQVKYWSSRKPQCTLDTLSTRSISIYETAPALLLLVFGVTIGSIICIAENIIYYRFMRKEMLTRLSSDGGGGGSGGDGSSGGGGNDGGGSDNGGNGGGGDANVEETAGTSKHNLPE
ncbi:ionotropic receptor 75a [Monomorium pharaonis]|uniref:ionotropic receptor 75a n=1 Tax=Monomorium pharaonis TaxID=307658 RepID=UPI001746E269|nr:ionotropic receptor 75a [Monomorium pharaonis]